MKTHYNLSYEIPEALIKQLERKIVHELDKVGIFYRIFSRVKSNESTNVKLRIKDYSNSKKMQDLLGIRVVLYFNDDMKNCERIISDLFTKVDESIDKPDAYTFRPTRRNIIYKLDSETAFDISPILRGMLIDDTFELQIRTVFSEGWHEVEHDLRYKCESEWGGYPDYSRTLNGLVATLETCDWSILKLFSDLAYENYKDENIIPMLRNKFRIRFLNDHLDSALEYILKENKGVLKNLFRLDREEVITELAKCRTSIPLTFNNIIYLCNYYFLKEREISEITPKVFIDHIT